MNIKKIDQRDGYYISDGYKGQMNLPFIRTSHNELISEEDMNIINKLYTDNPYLLQEDNSWIQTFSGKKFFPLNPTAETICLEDIAHSLSMLCRFTGHCDSFYSVAQHSVLVSLYCKPEYALSGLLHDASEAYLCDISSPLKRTKAFDKYREIENRLQSLIYKTFGLNETESDHIKYVDSRMFSTESKQLLKTRHNDFTIPYHPFDLKIKPLPPKAAEHLFLSRYYELVSHNDI